MHYVVMIVIAVVSRAVRPWRQHNTRAKCSRRSGTVGRDGMRAPAVTRRHVCYLFNNRRRTCAATYLTVFDSLFSQFGDRTVAARNRPCPRPVAVSITAARDCRSPRILSVESTRVYVIRAFRSHGVALVSFTFRTTTAQRHECSTSRHDFMLLWSDVEKFSKTKL